MKYIASFGVIVALAILFFVLQKPEPVPADQLVHTVAETVAKQDTTKYPYQKTEEEWKQILTAKEYRILRERGTEFPYVNEYDDNKREGIYVCAACGQKLYSSENKYDSGTGWPSFWKPIADSLVGKVEDNSLFMTRTEIVCSNCGSHLGHVFDDGPQPTGLRYCMNSAALDFIAKEDLTKKERSKDM